MGVLYGLYCSELNGIHAVYNNIMSEMQQNVLHLACVPWALHAGHCVWRTVCCLQTPSMYGTRAAVVHCCHCQFTQHR